MGIHRGPNPVNDGLTFGYDTGYNSSGEHIASGRFFKGPAHTNLIEDIDPSYTNTDTTNFKGVSGQEIVDIPIVGKRTVKYVDYFNNYPASGSCCPNLFHYHANDGKIPVEASTSYTYSIIYKHSNNYTHPNFMYRYEYQSDGTYNTEGGFHSTASDRRTNLGNGWYHAWGSFTTQSTTSYLVCYSFLYNYGTVEYRYYVAAVSLVKNVTGQTHFIIPPQLMLEPLGSVGNTASVIDLKRTNNIDVSNVSFDSNGQPTFDNTDDRITIPNSSVFNHTSELSIEACVKFDGNNQDFIFEKGNVNTQYSLFSHGTDIVFRTYHSADSGYDTLNPSKATAGITNGQWHHIVGSWDGSTKRIYVDGKDIGSKSKSGALTTTSAGAAIGSFGGTSSGYYFGGDIAVVKIYDKGLSAAEVLQNYNAYKNRFNI